MPFTRNQQFLSILNFLIAVGRMPDAGDVARRQSETPPATG
jgi:hypothetical protein